MTREQFYKYKFQHSEVIIFHQRHPEEDIEMMLIGIDFDLCMLKLAPINIDYYEDEANWIPIERCDKKIKRVMKVHKKKR